MRAFSMISPLMLLTVLTVADAGFAATLAAWDFEDEDLIVDVTSPGNEANAITSEGGGLSWSRSGNPGGTAVSFNALTSAGQVLFQAPLDASAATAVHLRFSLRPSNTANKWWRVELSVGGGAFTAVGPLVELTGETWSSFERELPTAASQGDVRVRVVVTDSNGDGTGELVRASGSGAPATGGTVRVDDVIFDEGDDEEPPPVDAGPLPPTPVITEVAWMGSVTAANDEWVELYNPGPDDIADLSRYVLMDGTTPRTLPAVPLLAGAIVVLEAHADATSLEPPEAEVISLGLTNSGEALRICPLGSEDVLEECDIASLGGAWAAGSNTPPKPTMVRVNADLDGSVASSWIDHEGPASSVTDSGGVGIFGSPGSYEPLDITPPSDGGVIEPPDAGPNAPPSLTLLSPTGEARPGRELSLSWKATDPDGDDTVSVALFYDTDESGYVGVEIVRGLPAEGSHTWHLQGVPAGRYSIFGMATDHRGEVAYAYAPGVVLVEGGGGPEGATLKVTDPDGVNDLKDGRVTVRWDVTLPEGEDGTVSLFYDEDDEGLDGEPIIAGLPVRAVDGSDGPRAFLWDPAGVPPGAYTVYAVLDWAGGSISSYSSYVSIGGEGSCACASTGGGTGMFFLGLFGLVVLFAPRARRRRHNGPRVDRARAVVDPGVRCRDPSAAVR